MSTGWARGSFLLLVSVAAWACLAGIAVADPAGRHVQIPLAPESCAGCHSGSDGSVTWSQQVSLECLECHSERGSSGAGSHGAPAVYDSSRVVSGHELGLPGAGPSAEAGSLQCASCHSFHGGSAGSGLLEPSPGAPAGNDNETAGWGSVDDPQWCGSCHQASVDASAGGTLHNHPGSCTACHGDPASGSSEDFPHTSAREALLIRYPDALCIGCHAKGSIP